MISIKTLSFLIKYFFFVYGHWPQNSKVIRFGIMEKKQTRSMHIGMRLSLSSTC